MTVSLSPGTHTSGTASFGQLSHVITKLSPMYEYWTWGWVKTYNDLRWVNLFRSHSHLFHSDVGIPWPLPGRFAASKEPEAQAGWGRRGWTWWGERGIRADGAHVCEGGREGRELLSFVGIREIRSWATLSCKDGEKKSQHSLPFTTHKNLDGLRNKW